MASIETIVKVVITKGTRQVPLAGFGTPIVFGPSNRFGDPFRIYTDPADMIADGFLVSDPEYIHAVAIMSQDPSPVEFIISKYSAPVAQVDTISVTTVANTTLYTATVNGIACSYTSDGSATGAEIQAGLIAAINGSSQAPYVTASAGAGTDVVVTSDEAGLGFTLSVTANLSVVITTPNHSIVDDIVTEQAANDTWYGAIITSKASADIRQVAAYIETQKKIFIAASSDAGILTSGSTDLASYLAGKSYARTALIYSGTPLTGPDAAWLGRMLPTQPGSSTWKFKLLVSITPDNLSATQIANAQGKHANIYIVVGGVDITTEGVATGGEYIDVTVFIDWLTARMEENVFSLLINNDKVPYTNKGIATVENAVRQTLVEGLQVGGIADVPAFTVSVPDVLNVSSGDKASRTLNNVRFSATLAGAIHKVNIDGFVSV